MRDLVHAAAGIAALIWWAPSILLAVATALAFAWGVRHRLRRVDWLLDAGREGEARRVYAALERDMAAKGRGRR